MEGTAPSPLLPKSSVILFYYIPVPEVGFEPYAGGLLRSLSLPLDYSGLAPDLPGSVYLAPPTSSAIIAHWVGVCALILYEDS